MLLVLYILREPRSALSRPELYLGRRSIGTVINSAETYLDAKTDAYDAHIERMAKKREQLLAYQERTWAAIEKNITLLHLLPLKTRLYTRLDCQK